MKIKKILSLLLAVVMVVGLVPSTVLAAEGGVAEVGGAAYATLLDAVNAAKAGDTITMLDDCTIELSGETYADRTITLPDGVTLDLNGKTLTVPFQKALFAGEDITIKNGTLTTGSTENYVLYIMDGSFTVKDVTTTNGINIQAGEVTLDNVNSTCPNKYYAVYAGPNTEVNILSGEYKTVRNENNVYVDSGATVNISGGTFDKNLKTADNTATINITGGIFADTSNANQYVVAGSTIFDNGDGTFTVIPPSYVAEISGTKYATLLEAVNAAQVGETIKLIDDCTLATGVQDQVITLPDNAVLDLNGKTLTIPFRDAWFAGNNITIENGTLTTGGLENYVLYINGGSFTVKDVTTTNGINVQTGKATLENVDVTNPNKYYAVYAGANTEVSILSGTFKKVRTDKPIILYADAGATVDISGGTFELNLYAVNTATIAVSGGIFANPVEPGHCAEGYEPVDNGDGTYGVKAIDYVAEVDGTKYTSLLDAVNAAQAGQTITLLRNYTIETAQNTIYEMPEGSTLDLNDKVLKIPYLTAFFTGSNITIKNGDIIKTADYADYALFIGDNSTVTISDVESNAGINIQNNSKATLENVVAQNFYKYYAVYAGEGSEVTILSGYFDGGSKNKDLYGGITVYGGSYEHDPSAFVADGYRAGLVNGRYEVGQIATFTLTFETNGGTEVSPVGAAAGSTIGLADKITTREGYTFTGWYLNEDLTNKVDSVQVIKDTTVYAGWERNQLTVTFDAQGGSVYPESASVLYGATLSTLPTPTRSGWYSFDGWYTAPNGGTRVTTSTVFYGDTTIYAHWDYIYIPMPNYYTLTFDVNGGTDISSIRRVSGSKIDLTDYVTTREGYTFDGWYSDEGLTNKITSVKLTKNTTVYAGWTEIVETPDPIVNPFKDVHESDWFYDDVMYVYERDLMNGTAVDMFSPALTTTRGMIVTILYRMEGEPSTDGLDNPFIDLTQDWYVDAVKWAAANGIVEGYGDGKYGPEDPITREQMATILWRYAKHKGVDVSSGNGMNIEGYADDEQISSYAVDAMKWVIAEGIIGGRPGGVLDPTGNAQRCEVAAIIHRFCELIEN